MFNVAMEKVRNVLFAVQSARRTLTRTTFGQFMVGAAWRTEEAERLEVEVGVDGIRDRLVPRDGLGRAHPARGRPAVLVGGECLHGATQSGEQERYGGGNQQAPVLG